MLTLLVGALVSVMILLGGWWVAGRATAQRRSLHLHGSTEAPPRPPPQLVVVAWNVAHGRGQPPGGWRQNWQGGTAELRAARLRDISRVVAGSGADLVVLNEIDFRAHWSHGRDQARVVATAAGYPQWLEQRNFDLRLPLVGWSFGNTLLSRLPIREVTAVPLPPHARWERLAFGAKSAAVAIVELGAGRRVAVVPVHLEARSEATRLAALEPLRRLRAALEPPLVLAGDFNSLPPGPPAPTSTAEVTVLGELVREGFQALPRKGETGYVPTYPAPVPTVALDWILVEPPLRLLELEVLEASGLSDHLPVRGVIELP